MVRPVIKDANHEFFDPTCGKKDLAHEILAKGNPKVSFPQIHKTSDQSHPIHQLTRVHPEANDYLP